MSFSEEATELEEDVRLLQLEADLLLAEMEADGDVQETKVAKLRHAYRGARLAKLQKGLTKAKEKLSSLQRCRDQEIKVSRGSSGRSS